MAKPCWKRAYPPPAKSAGCKVTGKTQEHRHRHCRCQVCWGGNCQCGRPAASGRAGEKMRSSLWWSLFARGASSISAVAVYPIPLCPPAPLCILLIVLLFASFARSPRPSCFCSCSFPICSIFLHLFSHCTSPSLLSCSCTPWVPLSIHWEAAASPQFSPPAGLLQ